AWFVRDETAGAEAATRDAATVDTTRGATALRLQRWCSDGRGGEGWPLPAAVQVADVAAAPDGAVALLLVRGEERWLELLEPAQGTSATVAEPAVARGGAGMRSVARLALPSGAGSIAWHGADVVLVTVFEGDGARVFRWRVARGSHAITWLPWMASPVATSVFALAAAADGVVVETLRGAGPALAWWPWEVWEAWEAWEAWEVSEPGEAREMAGAAAASPPRGTSADLAA